MKKVVYLLFALTTLCAVLSGCRKDDEFMDIVLEETSVRVSYLTHRSLRIDGGSGQFEASIDRPEIADVTIDQTYGAGTLLSIQTKQGGEALITVTDTKTRKKAECSLFVSKDGISITDVEYGVDADEDQVEIILADLRDHEVYPVESRFLIAPFSMTVSETGEWTILSADSKEIESGTYVVTEEKGMIPPACLRLIPINEQIITWCTYQVNIAGAERMYYMVVVQAPGQMSIGGKTYGNIYFYEDLTEVYQAKYPDAGVNAVVRAYIRKW